jgi:hypothetical protein
LSKKLFSSSLAARAVTHPPRVPRVFVCRTLSHAQPLRLTHGSSSAVVDWALPVEQSADAYREPASEPRLEPFKLRITDDSLVASGDPQAIANIHSRQSLSNDLQRITKNILAGLFVVAGMRIIYFLPQNKYTPFIMGVFLLLSAAGICGFTNLSFRGFGFSLTAGQSQPNATTRTRQRAILWVLLGGGAVYASRYILWFG